MKEGINKRQRFVGKRKGGREARRGRVAVFSTLCAYAVGASNSSVNKRQASAAAACPSAEERGGRLAWYVEMA